MSILINMHIYAHINIHLFTHTHTYFDDVYTQVT